MQQPVLERQSPYRNCRIVLTTKHEKVVAIRPAFEELLAAEVVACEFDTDQLGTFSGEVDREGTVLECARRKCETGMELTGAQYGLASEGSFGPHPTIPFFPCEYCNLPTELVACEINGCVSCMFSERAGRSDGQKSASQRYCAW